MITGIGTDVVDVGRFCSLEDPREFLEQVFTKAEIDNAPTGPARNRFFASLFAVKEALLKAMGCGLHLGLRWREIEVTKDWKLHLSGRLERVAGEKAISAIHVSQTHSANTAVAFVVLERTNREGYV